MGAATDLAERKVIKAAKKTLKRQDSGSMKIKSLAKSIIEESTSNGDIPNCKDTVRKMISEASHVFDIEGKTVTLKKKKRGSSSSISGISKTPDEEETRRKTSKKAKTDSAKAHLDDEAAVLTWRKDHKIVLKDSRNGPEGAEATKLLETNSLYFPFQTFDSPKCVEELNASLISQCTKVNGFVKPSPIQAQCWPILLHVDSNGRHRDVVGIAETGSGKTLAFSMPALSVMAKSSQIPNKRGRYPKMLILAPTRELAMQSQKVLEEFGQVVNLTSAVIYGGVPKPPQKDVLRKGVDCIVCTPGRLKDLINEGACNLGDVTHLVLDEADRMLDMGFEEDVRFIISQCKSKEFRQTAMFSATWPAAIQQLALEFMVDPVCIYVGFESIVGSNGENAIDDSLSANKRVSQTVEVIEDRAREARLRELVGKYSKGKKKNDRILVFALYKKEAARLEGTLNRWGYSCASIHGDKTQDARNRALAEFKDGSW
ncbi:hypothetical protein ACHAWX_003768 [Stephanocyclus meneghinianus]